MRALSSFLLLATFVVVMPPLMRAQSDSQETAQCTFEDGKQIVARYNKVSAGRSDPPLGKPWSPGGSSMTLFTEADITLAGKNIPMGGYTMYVIPNKKDWTLIVSKNTSASASYDEGQDLARAQMETGTLSQAEKEFKLFFGHLGPKVCEINLVYGKSRAWVEFKER